MTPSEWKPLPRDFFEPSAAVVAPKLLGKLLVRNAPDGLMAGVIVETEAYLAGDPACHGFPGETPRNRSMYGPPGHAYVYFIYGNHWCVNAVCRPQGCAEAVLIRAVEPVHGIELMRTRRRVSKESDLSNGPGKLCIALGINRDLDGVDLCNASSALWIARNPVRRKTLLRQGPMVTTTRVGITKAADLPLRFYLPGSAWVSKRAKTATGL